MSLVFTCMKIFFARILDVSFIHMGKQKLIQVTNELLNFEEKSIEDILLS